MPRRLSLPLLASLLLLGAVAPPPCAAETDCLSSPGSCGVGGFRVDGSLIEGDDEAVAAASAHGVAGGGAGGHSSGDFVDYAQMGAAGPRQLGRGVADEDLPEFMLTQEFDPLSAEGELYKLSSLDTLEDIFRAVRLRTSPADLLPPQPADTAAVEGLVAGLLRRYSEGLERYEGIRELRACVLGSGDMKGVDVAAFEGFEEVSLADVDVDAGLGTVSAGGSMEGRLSLHREDLTGLLAAFRWKTEYLYGVVDSPAAAWEVLSRYLSGDGLIPEHTQYDTGFNSSLGYVALSDVVVFNMVMPEVAWGFQEHLVSEMLRLKAPAWGISRSDIQQGISGAWGTAADRIADHLFARVLKKVSLSKQRRLVLFLSLRQRVDYKYDGATGERFERREVASGNADQRYLDTLNEVGTPMGTGEETMVTKRWADEEGQHYLREDTVHVSGFTIGKELPLQEWLDNMKSGMAELYSG